jgi:hypothetical protein
MNLLVGPTDASGSFRGGATAVFVGLWGRSMSHAVKAIKDHIAPLVHAADNDVLHFLSRTLQAHILDTDSQGVLGKLQNLMIALEQQESTLSDWPDSSSKDRICAALAKARSAVSQIVEDIGGAAQNRPDRRAAGTM